MLRRKPEITSQKKKAMEEDATPGMRTTERGKEGEERVSLANRGKRGGGSGPPGKGPLERAEAQERREGLEARKMRKIGR